MKVYHGHILTVDADNRVARYLVEDGGIILFVGDVLPERYSHFDVIELGGRALCPSFVDTHEHLASFAMFNAGLNVMNARSNAEIVEMVRQYCRSSTDSGILIAFGASPYSVQEGCLVTRAELDKACPDRPFMLVKYDGHACVVNSALLGQVESHVVDLRGYHPGTGEMNQEAFFAISDYVTKSISIPNLVRSIQRAMDYLADRGIGMVHTVSGVGFAGDLDISLEKWLAKSAQSGFQIRVFPQSLDVKTAVRRKIPRIGGCFACALDGCFGSQDAAMSEPYRAIDSKGVLYYSDEVVESFCKSANRAGLQIELHAIGDAAFSQAVRCIKAALDDYPNTDHRHGIIHACLPTQEGLDVCARYGIQLAVQTAFIDWPQEPDSYLRDLLGEDRLMRLNPLRFMADKGIVMSAGSDAPCTDPDPIAWMYKACNHSNPGQSLSIREALRICTYNGYWVTHDERDRGSLETGKIADMVILSADPYEMDAKDLLGIRVEKLLLQGSPYQPQSQGFLSAMLGGALFKGAF